MVVITPVILSQNPENTPSNEDLYKSARNFAFNGERKKARGICYKILKSEPLFYDVSVLLGRTYSWDKQYDSAKIVLNKIFENKPFYYDALDAMVDINLWTDSFKNAIVYADKGLSQNPNEESFLFKKARALNNLGEKKSVVEILNKILSMNPSDKDALNLLQDIKDEGRINSAALNYYIDVFNPYIPEWHIVSAQLSRKTKIGTIMARVNYGNRFNTNGWQIEMDAYPAIRKGTYLYLNAGYSPSIIFPYYRLGIEVHQKIPKSFEASLGVRYLNFDPQDVIIYTGSVGKYWSNYWFSFRPYFTPGPSGVSQSYNFIARRYFSIADNYIGLTVGFGYSPDDRVFLLFDQKTAQLQSQKIYFDFQQRIFNYFIFSCGVGYANEEWFTALYRNKFSGNIGLSFLF